jgi:hypothetical protein
LSVHQIVHIDGPHSKPLIIRYLQRQPAVI